MALGYFSLVLHAHLPFVRHPEDPTVMEEQWLYEAITGTYLPLVQVFDGLVRDHIPCRCTVSLSAPLMTMLTDDLLKLRYAQHLDKLIELADLRGIEPRITADVFSVLGVDASVQSRTSEGGTAPANVRRAAERWIAALKADKG